MTVGRANRLRSSARLRSLARGIRGFVLGAGSARTRERAVPAPEKIRDHVAELRRVDLRPAGTDADRLNLLIPSLLPERTFGGIQTALNLFAELARGAPLVRVISMTPSPNSMPAGMSDYVALGLASDETPARSVVSIAEGPGLSLAVGPRDIFVATFWTTAELAAVIRRWQAATFGPGRRPMAYVIQDFEPGFYPFSAQSLLVRGTYLDHDQTIAIFNTSLLRDYFHAAGLAFAVEHAFEPRLSPALRALLPAGRTDRARRIVIYGRPGAPRNAFPLIIDGLRAWAAADDRAGSWSVVSVGQAHPDIDVGGGVVVTSRGKLSLDDYGRLLAESAIGISLMVSPHPSYPPLEMAQFGMLVLTNRFGGKDLATWHTNIESLDDESADGLARQLSHMCRRFEADPGRTAKGHSNRPEYVSDDPQFPFAAEVAAQLRADIGS